MAYSNLIISFLTLLTFVSHVASIDIISTVCLKMTNPSFCSSVLKFIDITDLKGLDVYTLNLAYSNAAKSMALASYNRH